MNPQIVPFTQSAVLELPLHDARVRGLLLCDGSKLMMPVETSQGIRQCLILDRVERLYANDFREGNVILDATVYSGAEIDVAEIALAYGVPITESQFLDKTKQRLIQEKLLLLAINPSYGCSVVCICGSVRIDADIFS
jgi:hypothetical protein